MTSMYREALTATLRCPRCNAANRPSATYIEIDETGKRAFCGVCSHDGPIETFTLKEK